MTRRSARSSSEALGLEGYVIETAGSASEALAAVGRHVPDLILLDMRMPDDGPLFEAELRRRSLRAPIIATSASAEGPKWAAEIGVRFLPKPSISWISGTPSTAR